MWRRAVVCMLVVVVTVVQGSENRSCVSKCHSKEYPQCGIWLHRDNIKEVSGIYLLGEGGVNFTCTVNSLPKPATIDWLFRSDYENEWRTVRCSSMLTSKHCRLNAIGEHQVTSQCLLKTEKLLQSGAYRCSARLPDARPSTEVNANELAVSPDAVVKVFGIESLTLVAQDLSYNGMGSVTVRTCGNPKPDVVWVNTRDDTAVQAGQTNGRLSALPLQAVSMREDGSRQGPAETQPYCYLAKLFISRVGAHDHQFLITVSNQANTKYQHLQLDISNVPRSSPHVQPILAVISFTSLLSIAFRAINF
uniref:Ig-like domain-containing protein n=1 Tax=Plectus sambesii TaxID=2011161 RepID=A0A914XB86_9BILA